MMILLQHVQNILSHVITQSARRSSAKPLLESLHWQPVRQRVTYKLATVCFKARLTSTPSYLQSLLMPHVPSRPLWSGYALRMAIARTRTVFASHVFSVAAPTIWNSLSDNVVNLNTLATFNMRLNIHLFRCVMWNVLATERLCISYYGGIQVFIIHLFISSCLFRKINTCQRNCYHWITRWTRKIELLSSCVNKWYDFYFLLFKKISILFFKLSLTLHQISRLSPGHSNLESVRGWASGEKWVQRGVEFLTSVGLAVCLGWLVELAPTCLVKTFKQQTSAHVSCPANIAIRPVVFVVEWKKSCCVAWFIMLLLSILRKHFKAVLVFYIVIDFPTVSYCLCFNFLLDCHSMCMMFSCLQHVDGMPRLFLIFLTTLNWRQEFTSA